MSELQQLVPLVDALTAQFSQFQTEARVEFSAVHSDMQTLRADMQTLGEALTTRMQVLHEDVITRIALLGEDPPRGGRATGTSAGRRRRR